MTDRVERAFLAVAYAVALAFPLAILLFYDGPERLRYLRSVPAREARPRSPTAQTWSSTSPGRVRRRRLRRPRNGVRRPRPAEVSCVRRRARRVLLPLLLAAALAALWGRASNGILTFATTPPAIVYDLFWWQIVALLALPVALLGAPPRASRSGDVGRARRPARADAAERAARRARAGDSTIRRSRSGSGFPSDASTSTLTDEHVRVPEENPANRAVTRLEHDGEPLAVLVHDPTLRDEPKLVEAVRPLPGLRSRTRVCTPRCRRSSRGEGVPRADRRRRPTKSAGGSSATSTTARSSGSWRSRSSCGARSGGSARP